MTSVEPTRTWESKTTIIIRPHCHRTRKSEHSTVFLFGPQNCLHNVSRTRTHRSRQLDCSRVLVPLTFPHGVPSSDQPELQPSVQMAFLDPTAGHQNLLLPQRDVKDDEDRRLACSRRQRHETSEGPLGFKGSSVLKGSTEQLGVILTSSSVTN